MDGKAQLKRYLEQRRELGESEFLLDSLSIEDALKMIGAMRGGVTRPAASRPTAPAPSAPVVPATHETIAPEPPAPPPTAARPVAPMVHTPVASTPSPSDVDEESIDMKKAPPGLVVGTTNESMFTENPFADLQTLDDIAARVARCRRCDLYKTATNPVPGEGDPKAKLMCVGEAPGANEDATGRPFVGASGQLLTKILAAIDLAREDVFIANVIKHRPPGNRNPTPKEVEACSPYLIRQIEIIRPKVIVAFGTFAAQTLLETKMPIGKLRGAIHRYHGVPLIVTYHPAALLRNPAWKRPTWDDVKLARKILDGATA